MYKNFKTESMSHKTRKDKRQLKTGAKAVSFSCRNNGTCPYCTSNRTYKNTKLEASILDQLIDLNQPIK